MTFFINGYDATEKFDITKADITDFIGGKADTLHMELDAQDEGFWGTEPALADIISVADGPFLSGDMHIDSAGCNSAQTYYITASSIPVHARAARTQGWEDVRLSDLLREFSKRYSLGLDLIEFTDHVYKRVRQDDQADLTFINFRCALESYALKISGGKMIVYPRELLKTAEPAREYTLGISDEYKYKASALNIYDGVRIRTPVLSAEFVQGTNGRIKEYLDISTSSIGEAERFCKGLLAGLNEAADTLSFSVELDTGIAAGTKVEVDAPGPATGLYVCEKIVHRIVDEETDLLLSKAVD